MAPSHLSAHDVAKRDTTHRGVGIDKALWRSASSAALPWSSVFSLTTQKTGLSTNGSPKGRGFDAQLV